MENSMSRLALFAVVHSVFFLWCYPAQAEQQDSVGFDKEKTECMARYYQLLVDNAKAHGDTEAKYIASRETGNCMDRFVDQNPKPARLAPADYDEEEVHKYMDLSELELIRMCASAPPDFSEKSMKTLMAICEAQGRVSERNRANHR
jgi:hypothetical protein